MTVATVTMLIFAVGIMGWLGYSKLVAPRQAADQFFELAVDLRGGELPDLKALAPVAAASVERELGNDTTIVAFLMTTCPACNRARPTLEELGGLEGVGVVTVFAEAPETVEAYATSLPRFTDAGREVFEAFGASSVPMILVARDGKVVSQTIGWSPAIERQLRTSIAGGS